MIIDDGIYIKYKIKKKSGFYFILSNIRGSFGDYDKKENDIRKQRKNQEKIDSEEGRERTFRTRVSRETMNTSWR